MKVRGEVRAAHRRDILAPAVHHRTVKHHPDAAHGADIAANELLQRFPDFSAAAPFSRWQRYVLGGTVATLPIAAMAGTELGFALLSLILSVPFALVILIRLAALFYVVFPQSRPPASAVSDVDLPTYSVLVPLYHEGEIAPALIEAMRTIDYPREKLEIIFITEAADHSTREALRRAKPSSYMHRSLPSRQARPRPNRERSTLP